jgi:hypothetical protein
MLGRGTGKMVALLNTAREQFTRATQDTELSKVCTYVCTTHKALALTH